MAIHGARLSDGHLHPAHEADGVHYTVQILTMLFRSSLEEGFSVKERSWGRGAALHPSRGHGSVHGSVEHVGAVLLQQSGEEIQEGFPYPSTVDWLDTRTSTRHATWGQWLEGRGARHDRKITWT